MHQEVKKEQISEQNIDALWKEIFKLYKANRIGEVVTLANNYITEHPTAKVKVFFLLSNLFGTSQILHCSHLQF